MAKILDIILFLLKKLWEQKVLVLALLVATGALLWQFMLYRKEDEVFKHLLFLSGAIELFNFVAGLIFYFLKEKTITYFFWIVGLAIASASIWYVKFVVFNMM